MAFAMLVLRVAPAVAQTSYSFDSSASSIEIDVYKEGLFSAFAHNHLVAAKDFSGSAQFDPANVARARVTLHVASKSLTVVDPGESENSRQQVQATMAGDQVLDVARYPDISFRSTGVTQVQQEANGWHVMLAGRLQLHGVERPAAFPLSVRVTNGELIADGETFLKQSDFGIAPIRIAGGAVKVKDRLRIHFEIHARPQ